MHFAALLPSGETLIFLVPLTAIGGLIAVRIGRKIKHFTVISLLLGHYEGGGIRARGVWSGRGRIRR